MILGIDAANIRVGGGVTHLSELLSHADPAAHGFSRVIVWSGTSTIDGLPRRPWLEAHRVPVLDRSLLHRTWWQARALDAEARRAGVNVLFVPGGSYAGAFRPLVTFNQNLLPFEWPELRRFGVSLMTLKMLVLRLVQGRTFRSADGVIFLTDHARAVVTRALGEVPGRTAIIAHGIDTRFTLAPQAPQAAISWSQERPCRVLYVSAVYPYKHQVPVVRAVAQLRAAGRPVTLDLIGPGDPAAIRRLNAEITRLEPSGTAIRYLGAVPYDELPGIYGAADLAVFASTCETFGQILTEAMSVGLPIAAANRAATPELLGPAGEYFDPEDSDDIARALARLMDDAQRRQALAAAALDRSRMWSWDRCADDTFSFLAGFGRAGERPS